MVGWYGGAVISTITSQLEGFKFSLMPFCVELACSPCVCVGSI